MSTPSGRDGKRSASSPLSEDGETKRSCVDASSDTSFLDPDATILNTDFLSSTIIDQPAMSTLSTIKEEIRSVLCDPDLLELISKAVAAQVSDQVRKEIADLKDLVAKKDKEIELLKDEIDSLEQYSRRNCIRIGPIPESDREDTDAIVREVAKSIGVELSDEAIDRSHRVGKPPSLASPAPRPIIVKLTSYRHKAALMKARRGLRDVDLTKVVPSANWPMLTRAASRSTSTSHTGNPLAPKVFINEDLTRTRASVAAGARQMKRSKKISDTWTRDGTVFIKKGDSVYRVTTLRELEVLDV